MKLCKRLLFTLALLPIVLLSTQSARAQTEDIGFITLFNSHIELKKDGSVQVQEEVLYNFNGQERHGIYRELPLNYKRSDGSDVSVAITGLSIHDRLGNEVPFEVGGGGNFVSMKIGDPNKTVSGEVLYVIKYSILGSVAPLRGETGAVFAWDALGSGWNDPIIKSRVEIVLPQDMQTSDVLASCIRRSRGRNFECLDNHQLGTATGTVAILKFLNDNVEQGDKVLVESTLKGRAIYVSRRIQDHSGLIRFEPFRTIDIAGYLIYTLIIAAIFGTKILPRRDRLVRDYALSGLALVVLSWFMSGDIRSVLVLGAIICALASLTVSLHSRQNRQ